MAQTALFRTDGSLLWLNLGDFVSVAVFVWVYQRVRSCFRGGAAGGEEIDVVDGGRQREVEAALDLRPAPVEGQAGRGAARIRRVGPQGTACGMHRHRLAHGDAGGV